MRTLHIAPGDLAGGSLRMAVRDASSDDEVLSCRDNLSCGPIAADDVAERAEWWGQFYDDPNIENDLKTFWDRVSTTDDRLVVWFGRHSASELAFFHAWVDRLDDRSYELIDVTGRQVPFRRRDGTCGARPMESAGIDESRYAPVAPRQRTARNAFASRGSTPNLAPAEGRKCAVSDRHRYRLSLRSNRLF